MNTINDLPMELKLTIAKYIYQDKLYWPGWPLSEVNREWRAIMDVVIDDEARMWEKKWSQFYEARRWGKIK